MKKYIKLFETHSQYESFTQTEDFLLPNVSYCQDQVNVVHYNPIAPPIQPLMVTYNVVDASSPTQLYFYDAEMQALGIDMFDKVKIDGVEVSVADLDSTSGAYQLSSGEHTIAYTLKDPTIIGVVYNESTEKIGAAFSDCMTITSAQIPNTVTSIGSDAFYKCSSLTSVTIPNSVTSIGSQAFDICSGLTSIDIPNSVTSISAYAFASCTGLTSVTIPDSVTNIGMLAFHSCNSLTSVTIGSGVTSIDNNAFLQCSSLTSITSKAMTAPAIGNGTFEAVKRNGTLYVPQGSSGYDVWMGTGSYYLGLYNWTKVEQ